MKRFISLLTGLCLTTIIVAADILPSTQVKANNDENQADNIEYGAELDELKKVIATADSLIDLQGLIASKDEGEYKALKVAITKGRELLKSENTTALIALKKIEEINFLSIKYRKQYPLFLIDSISNITTNGTLNFSDDSNGWKTGDYPKESRTRIIATADDAQVGIGNATTLTEISAIISDLEKGFKELYNSCINRTHKLPTRFTADDGLPGTNEDGDPNKSYIWDSPLFYLNEPTDKIRITVTKATKQDNYAGSGTVMFCLGEFELYDAKGELIPLREDMFETNSLYSSDGGGIPSLIDGNHNTWYHSAYNASHDITPGQGEYSYVQVNLDEKISTFRYRMVGRPSAQYNRAPTDLGITAGDTYDPNNIYIQDPYDLKVIEKITDISQITSGGHYVLYGNMGKFDDDKIVGEGTGYYTGLTPYKYKQPHSCCLFTFEDAGDNKYFIHSLSENYYIKKPNTYESANSTYFKQEAATFTIQEHETHEDMFYIYNTGIVEDEYDENDGKEATFLLQDWGYEMGTTPIASLDAQTDLDGQSEWEIYKVSVGSFGTMWLESVLASIETMGFDYTAFGDNPGQYTGEGIDEFNEAYTQALALIDTHDVYAAKAAADKLQANMEALSTLEINPIITGGAYYIVSTYKAFYENQQKEMAIFTDINDNADSNIKSDNQPYWGTFLGEGEEDVKENFIWIVEECNTENIETTYGDTYAYLKNVATGEYLGTSDSYSINLPMSKTPCPYFFRSAGGVKYNIGSIDAQKNFVENSGTHYALHIPDHDDGKANKGHVCLWRYNTEQSRWRLIKATLTSIDNIAEGEEGEILSKTYYSIDGGILDAPQKGLNIIKIVYTNGTTKTKKVLIK